MYDPPIYRLALLSFFSLMVSPALTDLSVCLSQQLLLVARTMKKNKASSYVISVGESDEAESVVVTLRDGQISP